jgi:hypothetical protein
LREQRAVEGTEGRRGAEGWRLQGTEGRRGDRGPQRKRVVEETESRREDIGS